jgi:hypothetical protein
MQSYNNIISRIPFVQSFSLGKFINYPFGQSDLPYFVPNKNTNYIIGILEENLEKEGPEQFYYKMGNDELYIIVGLTPPQCLYYGYIQYLFRRGENLLFASTNDTLNLNIVEYFTNKKYRVPTITLISKNPRIIDIAYDFLINQKILPVPFIYKIPLPADKFLPDDTFVTILRVASLAAGNEEFLENTQIGFGKVKFTPRVNDPTNKYCFYSVGQPIVDNPTCKNGFYQKPRDSNIDEYTIPGLVNGFNLYTQSILNSINDQKNLYITKGYCKKHKHRECDCNKKRKPNGGGPIIVPPILPPGFLEIISQPWGFVKDNQYFTIDTGYNCIDNLVNCVGDNRDTTYRISDVIFTNDIEYVVVTGINHIITGKGLYTNINIYDNETQESLYNLDITTPDTLYYYIILTKDALKMSDGQISKQIFVAERVYLQRFISPSYETTIPYKIFINTPI